MVGSPPSAPPAGLPGPGAIINGKYRVERVLGMGGMGAVLAARHLELDETVAIKVLLPHLPTSGESATRFVREAKAAIRIRNEHVVRILDVARTPSGSPFIVMEYLDGSDLGQLVEKQGPLSVEDAVEYVLQACEAIAVAHAMGIIHRDLKPGNLFLARGGDGAPCVKVLDFGISKVSEDSSAGSPALTSTATVMGTPCFMSPEQLRSTRDVDARADIWSLGAILYVLLTGAPPYDGDSNADVSAKIIRDAPTPLRAVRPTASEALEAVILKCLQKDPANRFADVASLAAALAEAVARDSTRAAAARVTRLATGTAAFAATTPATPEVQLIREPAPWAKPGTDPTRTASAWGDTRREDQRKRRARWGLVAVGLIALGTGVVALRLRSMPLPVAPPPPASAVAATTAPEVVAPRIAVPAASDEPIATAASAPTPPAPLASAGLVPARPFGLKLPATLPSAGASAVRGAPSAKPVPLSAPSSGSGAGLFDGRQ